MAELFFSADLDVDNFQNIKPIRFSNLTQVAEKTLQL